MALFQKNPHSNTERQSLFTLGQNKNLLIVGLGNKGKQYEKTRHNIGFTSLDAFAEAHEFEAWVEKKDLKCFFTCKTLGDTRVLLCKPTTMMNLSGEAVQAVAHFYKVPDNQLVAVYDELDIPFGQIRTRVGGSSAGHNGVKSLIQHLGDNFGRIRIGIGSELQGEMDGADYVLAKFNKEELAHIKPLTREVISILTEYVYRGELLPETRSFII